MRGNFHILSPTKLPLATSRSPPAAPNDQMALTHWPSSSFHQPQIRLHIWIAVPAFWSHFFWEAICRWYGWIQPFPPIQIGTIPQFRMLRACGVFIELQKQLSSDAHFIRIKEEPRAQTDSQRFDKTRNHLEQITDHHPAWCSKLLLSQGNHKATTWQGTKSLQKKGSPATCLWGQPNVECASRDGFRLRRWVNLPIPKAFPTSNRHPLRPWPHGQLKVWIGKRQSGEWPERNSDSAVSAP